MRTIRSLTALLAPALLLACGPTGSSAPAARPQPLVTHGMQALAGQQETCSGPREKTFTLEVVEHAVEIGMGWTFEAWTYGGTLPGPTIEVCAGDRVKIEVPNHGSTSHGLDTHAFKIDATEFGPAPPGETLRFEAEVDTPGVYMYHCASGPVTDLHIKSGLHGAMIVYPRDRVLAPARELVVVEDAIFGTPDATGHIPGTDPQRSQRNDPELYTYNGWLEHQPLAVAAGEKIRVYFVNVGPGVSSLHVIGTILDRVIDGSRQVEDVQTYGVPAGSGVIVEFTIPAAGTYLLVDHDRLAFLPTGFALPFSAS